MVKQRELLKRQIHQLVVFLQIIGVDGVQVVLPVRHDGRGRDTDQALHTGADIAQSQPGAIFFQTEDGAAGQVVGQRLQAQLGIFALRQILHRAADADDVALLIAIGLAQNAGRKAAAVGGGVDYIQCV